jgi:uncharacterized protein YndB with AHSA1/START domain
MSKVSEMDDSYTLITTLEIDAPREKVWSAWEDPKIVAKWWGPAGFTSTVEELDLRNDGKFRVVMHGPDNIDYPNTYIFNKVDRPSQLIYTNEGSKQFGLAPFQSVMDFESMGSKTKVTLKMRFVSAEEKEKHVKQFHAVEGSRELLSRLEDKVK